mmetsp:Transcript_29663/g.78567  ORF Transcript_29663/g.78567 Transcript_29663/m.78567 type:complete len:217 (-) Transcript_29663:185-835(-)
MLRLPPVRSELRSGCALLGQPVPALHCGQRHQCDTGILRFSGRAASRLCSLGDSSAGPGVGGAMDALFVLRRDGAQRLGRAQRLAGGGLHLALAGSSEPELGARHVCRDAGRRAGSREAAALVLARPPAALHCHARLRARCSPAVRSLRLDGAARQAAWRSCLHRCRRCGCSLDCREPRQGGALGLRVLALSSRASQGIAGRPPEDGVLRVCVWHR